jgi:hypothetical protein
MDHTTPTTDTDALLAEVNALIAESDAIDARIEALLATGSTAVRMADLARQLELGRQELDQIEADQAEIVRQLTELERDP